MTRLFSYLIALLPFLYQYASPVSRISLGEFLLIPFLIYYFLIELEHPSTVNRRQYLGIYSYFYVAVLTSIIASAQSFFRYSDFLTIAARIVYYAFLIYFACKHSNFTVMARTIEIASLFFSVYLIMQFLAYHAIGKVLPTTLNPNWIFGPEAGGRLDYDNYYKWFYRPSSLFLEPGYFASYASVGLASFLLNKRSKVTVITFSLIVTLALVMSASTAGLAMLVIIYAIYIYTLVFRNKSISTVKKFFYIAVVVVAVIYIVFSNLAMTLLTRMSTGGSFNNRITRTAYLVKKMNIFQLLFGVGINNVSNNVIQNDLYTIYDEANLDFVSSLLGTLLCSGIFTFIFYIRFYLKAYFYGRNVFARTLVIMLLFESAIGYTSFTYSFAFFAILVIAAYQYEATKEGLGNDFYNMPRNR